MSETNMDRRLALKRAGALGAGLVAGSLIASKSGFALGHVATPSQTEGPFYPVRDQVDKDADMTRVGGRAGVALGRHLDVMGVLIHSSTGAPIENALVEFWQACASGKYNHPSDDNSAALDPNFQYWAQVRTDSYGAFKVTTVIPGAYPADPDWVRPPHIHIKVHAAGFPSLTTQLYFKGNPLNDTDKILQKLTPAQQEMVTVAITEANTQGGNAVAVWQIYLAKFAGVSENRGLTTPEIE
jgi:protocatechuate 3,4-dioxygenase, beta subunit